MKFASYPVTLEKTRVYRDLLNSLPAYAGTKFVMVENKIPVPYCEYAVITEKEIDQFKSKWNIIE
jgi:hypothetical protein